MIKLHHKSARRAQTSDKVNLVQIWTGCLSKFSGNFVVQR